MLPTKKKTNPDDPSLASGPSESRFGLKNEEKERFT